MGKHSLGSEAKNKHRALVSATKQTREKQEATLQKPVCISEEGKAWHLTPLRITPIQLLRTTVFCITSFAPNLPFSSLDSESQEEKPGALQVRATSQPHRGCWVKNIPRRPGMLVPQGCPNSKRVTLSPHAEDPSPSLESENQASHDGDRTVRPLSALEAKPPRDKS